MADHAGRAAGPASTPSVTRAGFLALAFFFFSFGACLGTWFVHIPVVAVRLGLGPAALGLALLGGGLGSLLFQPVAGLAVDRFGARRTLIGFSVALPLTIPVVINAPGPLLLFVFLFATGAIGGAANVGINTKGSEIEAATGRTSLPALHGFFSTGMFAAAMVGGLLIEHGWGDGRGALAVAVALVAAGVVAARHVPRAPGEGGAKPDKAPFALPGLSLLGLAFLGFLSTTIEFTVTDWSALFLTTIRDLSPGDAAFGLALFSGATALTRFAGGAVTGYLGPRNVVVLGGLLVALGMGLVLFAGFVPLSVSGFLLIGIGVSNLAPLFLSQAGRLPGVAPGAGVGITASGLTAGVLLAPPLIGFVAQVATLPVALSIAGVFGLVIAAGAMLRTWRGVAG